MHDLKLYENMLVFFYALSFIKILKRKRNRFINQTFLSLYQDLFSGTVAENIAYGENACSDRMEHIKQAAMLANAHHFIEKLPNGYNTELTNSASCLSGGQRQRLSLFPFIKSFSSIYLSIYIYIIRMIKRIWHMDVICDLFLF